MNKSIQWLLMAISFSLLSSCNPFKELGFPDDSYPEQKLEEMIEDEFDIEIDFSPSNPKKLVLGSTGDICYRLK